MTNSTKEPRRQIKGGRPSSSFPMHVRRMPVAQWPLAHQEAWARACRSVGPLSPPGPAAHLAPATKEKWTKAWGLYLNFLQMTMQLHVEQPMEQCLTFEVLDSYISKLMSHLRASSAKHQIIEMSYIAAAMMPGLDWSWVRRHPALPTAAEVRASRKPIQPPNPVDLLNGAIAMCDAADGADPTFSQAIQFRNGMILAIVTCLGLRRKNVAELQIGQHICVSGDCVWVVIEDSMKNGEVMDTPLPPWLALYVIRYLDVYRPILLGDADESNDFWINNRGEALDYTALRGLFELLGMKIIGQKINVHVLRHTMATGLISHNPQNIGIAAAALLHRSTKSVNQTYDRGGSHAADQIWRKLRRQLTQ